MGQQETAKQIWDYLTSRGWTQQSVSALLGNMQSESGIIADRWENDNVGNMSGGYGLVQWTPASKYIDWAKSNGLVYQDVISQCKRLEWEVANSQQFYNPNMTFAQFTKSTQTPEDLANIFIKYYERPLNPDQPARAIQARYWYNLFYKNDNNDNKGEDEMIKFNVVSGGSKGTAGFLYNGRCIVGGGTGDDNLIYNKLNLMEKTGKIKPIHDDVSGDEYHAMINKFPSFTNGK
ncbi:phage tail-type lysozyme [Lactococcus lactis]|uniref:phage tail tip lysozyme n=2 Tax=Lactococcus lactis TaxID=1358 RepID=UPI001CF20E5A|nr:phage tail tip lysozyme [Lactococcus lactis]UCS91465.1 phage tail-type lysozyme [Lactococcus lactis]